MTMNAYQGICAPWHHGYLLKTLVGRRVYRRYLYHFYTIRLCMRMIYARHRSGNRTSPYIHVMIQYMLSAMSIVPSIIMYTDTYHRASIPSPPIAAADWSLEPSHFPLYNRKWCVKIVKCECEWRTRWWWWWCSGRSLEMSPVVEGNDYHAYSTSTWLQIVNICCSCAIKWCFCFTQYCLVIAVLHTLTNAYSPLTESTWSPS